MHVFKNDSFRKAALIVFLCTFISISTVSIVNAVVYVYGRTYWQGYFSNEYDGWGGNVLIPSGGGVAIPGSIDTPDELISKLKNYYLLGNSRNHTGAAFVVNTMLGKDGKNASRTITEANWVDLTNRLNYYNNKGLISWGAMDFDYGINSYYQGEDVAGKTETNPDDDAFYHKPWSKYAVKVPVIIIYKLNGVDKAYILKRECANPLGGLDGIPYIPNISWTLSPNTTISNTIAYPGQTISWSHLETNTGLNETNLPASYSFVNSADLVTPSDSPHVIKSGLAVGGYVSFKSTRDINPDDAGKSFCRATAVSPYSYNNGSSIIGPSVSNPPACVGIPYNYNLTPTIALSNNNSVEVGSSFNITSANIENNKPNQYKSTNSEPANWKLSQFQVARDANIPSTTSTLSSLLPCDFFPTFVGTSNCEYLKQSTSAIVFEPGNKVISAANISVTVKSDLAVGTKLCYVLSVAPSSNSSGTKDGRWKNSAPVCLVVSKKPKVQVWGGDLKVGRNYVNLNIVKSDIRTSTSVKTLTSETDPRTFGSWAEYALVSPDAIIGAGSGSALYQGLPKSTGVDPCYYSLLTFSNSSPKSECKVNNKLGSYSFKKSTIPDIASKFPVSDTTRRLVAESDGNVNLSNVDSGLYTSDANINIKASTITAGKSIIINAPKVTVTIKENINYSNDSITGISNIPQLVIIARNINIEEAATNVDSWLIAKEDPKNPQTDQGHIYTCSGYPAPTAKNCAKKLTINGPVMANHLHLLRTDGSGTGTASGDPAEVLNLRADAYLWAYANASGSGRVWTVYSTNVPPRL